MLKYIVSVIIVIGLLVGAHSGLTAENSAAEMVLEGGARGKVPFPHRTHQTVLGDCGACHDLFPQEAGAIERLKAAGDLKRKQVMNKSCVKCHKAMKKQGGQAGPTTCSKCHIRE